MVVSIVEADTRCPAADSAVSLQFYSVHMAQVGVDLVLWPVAADRLPPEQPVVVPLLSEVEPPSLDSCSSAPHASVPFPSESLAVLSAFAQSHS